MAEAPRTRIRLTGAFGRPRIAMREPLLADGQAWPRRLRAGESVIAYFGTEVARHHLLRYVRRAYATSIEGETWSAPSPALRWFVAHHSGEDTAAAVAPARTARIRPGGY